MSLFLPPTVWIWGCIPIYISVEMGVVSTTSSVDVRVYPVYHALLCRVHPFSTASNVDVWSVALFPACCLDVQCVMYPSTLSSVLTCAGCINLCSKQCGRAGCISVCRQQSRRAGWILLRLHIILLNAGLSGIGSVRYVPEWIKMPMSGVVCYWKKITQTDTGISGTGLRYQVPECRCRRQGLDVDALAMIIAKPLWVHLLFSTHTQYMI